MKTKKQTDNAIINEIEDLILDGVLNQAEKAALKKLSKLGEQPYELEYKLYYTSIMMQNLAIEMGEKDFNKWVKDMMKDLKKKR